MQYKQIIASLLITVATVPSFAQQPVAAGKTTSAAAAVKADSAKVNTQKTSLNPANKLLASNIPATADKKGYSHVPLAGEKSYFGEKNEYVNDFVRKYLELHYNTLGNVQGRSSTPFSVIDNVLEKKNLPKELKYLAVIESALNHNAVSSAGAVGPWQLMKTTAQMMGLTVSRKNDERKDMLKSTTAATKYLELLYSQLNDWLLVIAAYNSGPVPVQKAIERTGSHSFWDIKEYLPHETQGHVLAFIATASIFENLSKFINLGTIPVDFKFGKEEELPMPAMTVPSSAPAATAATAPKDAAAKPGTLIPAKKVPYTDEELKTMTMVRITEPLFLDFVAQEIGFDKKTLIRWNTDYESFVYKTYPTPFYNLRIPKDKLDIFIQKKESLTKKSKAYYSTIK